MIDKTEMDENNNEMIDKTEMEENNNEMIDRTEMNKMTTRAPTYTCTSELHCPLQRQTMMGESITWAVTCPFLRDLNFAFLYVIRYLRLHIGLIKRSSLSQNILKAIKLQSMKVLFSESVSFNKYFSNDVFGLALT